LNLVVFGALTVTVRVGYRQFVHQNPDVSVKAKDAVARLFYARDHLPARAV
jgi:hypothetical protein